MTVGSDSDGAEASSVFDETGLSADGGTGNVASAHACGFSVTYPANAMVLMPSAIADAANQGRLIVDERFFPEVDMLWSPNYFVQRSLCVNGALELAVAWPWPTSWRKSASSGRARG
ncbi:MAG TPA: hypothetical protein VKP30_04530 [Polyangiaceae bacterium]|nr:hypothetical protein [Polyangiaceae bacterium]